jgi:hypothetical protein
VFPPDNNSGAAPARLVSRYEEPIREAEVLPAFAFLLLPLDHQRFAKFRAAAA